MPSTNLLEYLKHFLLPPQPGDWPAQFYSTQVIYETLQKYFKYTEASSSPHSQPQSFSTAAHSVHSYTMSYHSKPEKEEAIDQPDILIRNYVCQYNRSICCTYLFKNSIKVR